MAEPYDSLQPPQIAVTIRSLPRRVNEALAALDLQDVSLDANGVDGDSPLGIVDDIGRSLVVIDRGLEQTLLHEEPTVMAAVMDPAARTWEQPAGDRATTLAALDDAADELAARIETAPSDSWQRSAQVAGGSTVTALAVAREAARTGVVGLRRLESFS
ncbi:MAG: hypothetical protein ACR2QE_10320 [Acidimicrobiales bacterium]